MQQTGVIKEEQRMMNLIVCNEMKSQNKNKICVYAINLPIRSDRKVSIVSQFAGKDEFELNIIPGLFKYKNGALNLWETIQGIIRKETKSNSDYFILCEDDHQFTHNYSFEILKNGIKESRKYKADILLGGVSSFQKGVPINKQLFWVDKFSGLQFAVIFRQFYDVILNSYFSYSNDVADHKISSLTSKKFVIHPFISIQKEFGYSDVTQKNNGIETVSKLFFNSEKSMDILRSIYNFNTISPIKYGDGNFNKVPIYTDNADKWIQISNPHTFVIHAFEEPILFSEDLLHRILINEIKNQSEVLILQLGEMTFNKNMESFLTTSLLEGRRRNIEILLGDIPNFNVAVPITQNLFWIDQFQNFSFVMIYKIAYKKILEIVKNKPTCLYKSLSANITNKAVLFPSFNLRNKGLKEKENIAYLDKIKKIYIKSLLINSSGRK